MCAVLSSGVNPIAVDKYIILSFLISQLFLSFLTHWKIIPE